MLFYDCVYFLSRHQYFKCSSCFALLSFCCTNLWVRSTSNILIASLYVVLGSCLLIDIRRAINMHLCCSIVKEINVSMVDLASKYPTLDLCLLPHLTF